MKNAVCALISETRWRVGAVQQFIRVGKLVQAHGLHVTQEARKEA